MEAVGVFFAALVLACFVEAILEYIFGIWWQPFPEELRPKVLMGVGLVMGITLCLCYKVDLPAELGLPASIIGQVLSGAVVGRGADYLHNFWDKIHS